MNDINVTDLNERMLAGTAPRIIDVREIHEYEQDHIEADNIPMGDIPGKLDELADLKEAEFVVCCRSGGRSGRIAMFLRQKGFSKVRNLEGGMLAWKELVNPKFDVQ